MGRLVHTGLGSSSLVAHVLPYPPPPPHVNSFVLGPVVINTHTHARFLSHFPSSPPRSFTQSPSPPRSLVRDGQTSPHRPRLVISRSTCPPISPPPPPCKQLCTRSCSNKHTHTKLKETTSSTCPPISPPPPPRKQFCTRSCSNKHTHTRSPDGWDQIPRWAGGWFLHQPPWSFGFDSQTRGTRENRAPPCVAVPGSSRVPVRDGQPSSQRPRLVVSRSTCPHMSPPPPRKQLCTRS
jgi:hypothetical protein